VSDVGAQATSVKQVFISHASKDANFAHRLADDLKRLGIRVWIAPESIRPGEGWVKAIERGMGESSHVVLVLTPAALESKWVEKETEVAIAQEREGHIQIFPLDVEPCEIPLLLKSYQMISFRRGYNAGLSQLANILGLRVMSSGPVRVPHHVAQRVPAPEVVSPTQGWKYIGHAQLVVAMTAMNGKLFAATSINQFWMRDPVHHDINWARLQHVERADVQIAAMATIDDEQLFVATKDDNLWVCNPFADDIAWKLIGHAQLVVAMTTMNSRLLAVTRHLHMMNL
jgi:hypothetical protein